jgi:hypothetical protein
MVARLCKHHAQGKKEAYALFYHTFGKESQSAAETFNRDFSISEFDKWCDGGTWDEARGGTTTHSKDVNGG